MPHTHDGVLLPKSGSSGFSDIDSSCSPPSTAVPLECECPFPLVDVVLVLCCACRSFSASPPVAFEKPNVEQSATSRRSSI